MSSVYDDIYEDSYDYAGYSPTKAYIETVSVIMESAERVKDISQDVILKLKPAIASEFQKLTGGEIPEAVLDCGFIVFRIQPDNHGLNWIASNTPVTLQADLYLAMDGVYPNENFPFGFIAGTGECDSQRRQLVQQHHADHVLWLRKTPSGQKYQVDDSVYVEDDRSPRQYYFVDGEWITREMLVEKRTTWWSAGPYCGGICRGWHDNVFIGYALLTAIGRETDDSDFLEVLCTNSPFQDGRGWGYRIPKDLKPETAALLAEWTRRWDTEIENSSRASHKHLQECHALEDFDEVLSNDRAGLYK